MAEIDAPGYKLSENPEAICNNCIFGTDNFGFCRLWAFMFNDGFSCNSWRKSPVAEPPKTGIIISFMPSEKEAELLAIEGGEPAEDLHLTLVALGKIPEVEFTQHDLVEVLDAFTQLHPPIQGRINGEGKFFTEDDGTAVWMHFDSPDLPDFRQALVTALEDAGIEVSKLHGFTPHITLNYIDDDEETEIRQTEMDVDFNHLVMMWGTTRVAFPLSGGSSLERLIRAWKQRGISRTLSIVNQRPCCPD